MVILSNEIVNSMFFSRLLKLKFSLVNIFQFGSYSLREILSLNGAPEHLIKEGLDYYVSIPTRSSLISSLYKV